MRALSKVPNSERTEIDRPDCRETDQLVEDVLSDVAKALWPRNTAPSIATEINKMRDKNNQCAVRTIERYMEGSREWSGDAIAVIVSEILKRHSMRNVKVVARR